MISLSINDDVIYETEHHILKKTIVLWRQLKLIVTLSIHC